MASLGVELDELGGIGVALQTSVAALGDAAHGGLDPGCLGFEEATEPMRELVQCWRRGREALSGQVRSLHKGVADAAALYEMGERKNTTLFLVTGQ